MKVTATVHKHGDYYKAAIIKEADNLHQKVVSDEHFTCASTALKHAQAWRNEVHCKNN